MKGILKKEETKRKNSTNSLKQFSSFKSKNETKISVNNNTYKSNNVSKLNSTNNLPVINMLDQNIDNNNINNDESDSNIKVFIRVRPFNNSEKEMGSEECVKIDNNSILIKIINSKNEKKNEFDFNFDKIFGGISSQEEVFNSVALPVINGLINGYNGTILAYGQTSSGKSFTMQGDIKNDNMKGLIPRIAENIYYKLSTLGNIEYKITVSVLEIYQEKIKDLLSLSNKNLLIRENQNQGVYVEGLEEINVSDSNEIIKILDRSLSNRTVNSTNMNEFSSRSHLIFQMNLSIINNDDLSKKTSKLYLVDLAGSEKISKTGATGLLLDEAKGINKSLTTLGMVIKCLTENSSGKQVHIPYRDSKLTRILCESLGGNSKTSLIITLSPSSFNDVESLSSLRFGFRAKAIKNKARINKETNISELKLEIDKLNLYSLKLQAKLDKTIIFLKSRGFNTNHIIDDESDFDNFQYLKETSKDFNEINESVIKPNGADVISKVNKTIIEEDSVMEKTIIYNKQEKPLLAINREISSGLNESKLVGNNKEISAIEDIKIKYVELLYVVNELENEKNEFKEKYESLFNKKNIGKALKIIEGDFFSIFSKSSVDLCKSNVNNSIEFNKLETFQSKINNSNDNSKNSITNIFSKHLGKKTNNNKIDQNNKSCNDTDINNSIKSNDLKELKSVNISDNNINTQITFKVFENDQIIEEKIQKNNYTSNIQELMNSILLTFEEILFDLDLINNKIGGNSDIPYMISIYNDKMKEFKNEINCIFNGEKLNENVVNDNFNREQKKKFRLNYESNKSIITEDIILNMEKKANRLIHNHIKSIPGVEKVIYQPLFVKRNLNNFKYKFSN